VCEVAALDKSTGQKYRSGDADEIQMSDVNVSGASDSMATRRSRRNVQSMPSLSEIPQPPEISMEMLPPISDVEPLGPSASSSDELVPASSSRTILVGFQLQSLSHVCFCK